jgi:hypothetical protein
MVAIRDSRGRFVSSGGGASVKLAVEISPQALLKAIERAQFENLGHAAARISKDSKASLERAEGPSRPGTPPHTHRGAFIRRAVRFDHDRRTKTAVIGPRASVVGEVAAAHEFGGEYKDAEFPIRAFMGPALDKNIGRFASDWQGSIGG